jgi:hypothetical protein
MTYNFDPDRWYENELFAIKSKYQSGQMTKQESDNAVEKLDEKYSKMWKRLDGSFQLPK